MPLRRPLLRTLLLAVAMALPGPLALAEEAVSAFQPVARVGYGFWDETDDFGVRWEPPITTVTGQTLPSMFVGNTGAEFTDINVIDVDFDSGVTVDPLNTNDAAVQTAAINAELNSAMRQLQLQSGVSLLNAEIEALESRLVTLGEIDSSDAVDSRVELSIADTRSSVSLLQAEIAGAGTDSAGVIDSDKTPIFAALADTNSALAALDIMLASVDVAARTADTTSNPSIASNDRLADDLDGNGSGGFRIIRADLDGDGNIEAHEVVAQVIDFGDLHEFNVFFDSVLVESQRSITSLELAKQHVFFASGVNRATSGWRFEAYHNDWSATLGDEVRGLFKVRSESIGPLRLRELIADTRVSLYGTTGLRGIHHESDFYFHGSGSILGTTWVDQSIDHYAIGPQIGLGVVAEQSMFRFEAVALGVVGYGWADFEQRGIFGEEVIPGALNRSAAARTTASTHGAGDHAEEEYVAWHGETRLTASCQLTQRLRFDATWRWFITGPAYSAADAVQWNAPDFDMTPGDNGDFTSSDWFLGLTYTH